MNQTEHETALVNAFIVPEKQERLRTLLANPKRRKTILDTLNHFGDFNERFIVPIAPDKQHAEQIATQLRDYGAPNYCWVISHDRSLDARELPLDDALSAIVCSFNGTIVSCLPGRLAFYEGEWHKDRYILRRTTRG